MFSVEPLEITGEERIELERRARAHTSTQREARRARAILGCAHGTPLRQIAVTVGIDQHQVGVWRRRFLEHRLDGLNDQPRSGRPRRLGHDERLQMAAIAKSERDPADPVATWTYIEVAEALNESGIDVSVSQVWRISSTESLLVVSDSSVTGGPPHRHRPARRRPHHCTGRHRQPWRSRHPHRSSGRG